MKPQLAHTLQEIAALASRCTTPESTRIAVLAHDALTALTSAVPLPLGVRLGPSLEMPVAEIRTPDGRLIWRMP